METKKIIASGKWTVTQVVECESNCPVSKTVVRELRSGRIVGTFDDIISDSDARMIANAQNMIDTIMSMESVLSSILYYNALPSASYLSSILYDARLVIDNVYGRK